MAKSSKQPAPPPPTPPTRGRASLLITGGVALALLVAAIAYMRSDSAEPAVSPEATLGASAPAAAAPSPAQDHQAAGHQAAPSATPAAAPKSPVLKPHPQQNFPPLQFPGYPLGRSPEQITAAYRFAAEHPEILTYVPCFCGCERSGHQGNEDCFVKARGRNGDVTEWEEHGMECNVCIDVAIQAMQMYSSGASVRDIRTAVEAKWSARSSTHTPTPAPPQ